MPGMLTAIRMYDRMDDVRTPNTAMIVTLSELRANIYRLVDRIIESGEPLEIERSGRILRIVLDRPPTKLSRLIERRGYIEGDPDDLVHVDWSGEWKP